MRCFHLYESGRDPAELLRSENQWSTPWGASERGPCDKCGGAGRVAHLCLSCRLGPRPLCPACAGRREWVAICPACEGSGEITRTRRRGVSAFPTREGLLRYLAERRADTESCVILELDAALSGDIDLDADRGAVLVRPKGVLGQEALGSAGS
jgi:hypothetical protein